MYGKYYNPADPMGGGGFDPYPPPVATPMDIVIF